MPEQESSLSNEDDHCRERKTMPSNGPGDAPAPECMVCRTPAPTAVALPHNWIAACGPCTVLVVLIKGLLDHYNTTAPPTPNPSAP